MACGQHSKGNTKESWHSFSQKLSTANNFSASGWISYILLLHDEFRSGLSFPMAVHAVSAVMSSVFKVWLCEENRFFLPWEVMLSKH